MRLLGGLLPQTTKGRFQTFNDEHVFIDEWLSRHPDHDVTWVDIGAGDGLDMSNTYLLAAKGFSGVAIEGDPLRFAQLAINYRELPNVRLSRTYITPESAGDLLTGLLVSRTVDIISLDIDGFDLHVAEAVMGYLRPRLWIVEWNVLIPPGIGFSVRADPDFRWTGTWFSGCSLSAWGAFAKRHGYNCTQADGCALYLEDSADPGARPNRPISDLYERSPLGELGNRSFQPPAEWPDLHELSTKETLHAIDLEARKQGSNFDIWIEPDH